MLNFILYLAIAVLVVLVVVFALPRASREHPHVFPSHVVRYTPSHTNASLTPLIIAAVCKDVAQPLQAYILDNIESFFPYFNVTVVITESNSRDDATWNTLTTWADRMQAEQAPVQIYLHRLPTVDENRISRIARARETNLTALRFTGQLQRGEGYMLVLDCDHVNRTMPLGHELHRRLRTEWEDDPTWAVLTAVQATIPEYYDLFAVKAPWFERSTGKRAMCSPKKGLQVLWDKLQEAQQTQQTPPRVEVYSAFGGLALYRMQYLHDCRYMYGNHHRNDVCEHVTFHDGIRRNGGRVFIDLTLQNAGAPEHVQDVREAISGACPSKYRW